MKAQIVRNKDGELFLHVGLGADSKCYYISASDEAPQEIAKTISDEFELREKWDENDTEE